MELWLEQGETGFLGSIPGSGREFFLVVRAGEPRTQDSWVLSPTLGGELGLVDWSWGAGVTGSVPSSESG